MENNRPENIRGKSLEAMSTENLQELLRSEMESDSTPNTALIEAVFSVLDARTEQKEVDVDAAWDRFFHNHLPTKPLYPLSDETPAPQKGSRKKHLLRIGLIAALLAVFFLGAGLTASAAGYNILDAVMQWSSETLGFSFGQNSDTSSMKTNPEYADLKEALDLAGITTPLAPNYLPDGFRRSELYAEGGQFVGVYQKEDQSIVIQIQDISKIDSIQLEKDQEAPESYTAGGIVHYMSTNSDEYLSAWTHDGFECFISGVPSKEELIKIIDSIYLEETK